MGKKIISKLEKPDCTCVYEYNDDHHGLLVYQCPTCEKIENPNLNEVIK